jgi:hypothetical protein
VVDALLDALPSMFGSSAVQESAMGPALQAAFLVTNHVGGKLLLFQSGVPSLGAGKVGGRARAALRCCWRPAAAAGCALPCTRPTGGALHAQRPSPPPACL